MSCEIDWLEKLEIQLQLLSSLVRMICNQKAPGDRDIKSLGVDLLCIATLLNLSIQLEGKALRFAVLLFESVHLSCDLLEIADKANPNSFWNILIARTDPDYLGLPSKAISLAKLAKQAESRKGGAGPVIATSSNSIQENAPAVAVHAVKVEVDRETGKVSPKNYIAVQDVGFAINPMLIEGQVQGGVLQGLGWGLWEEMPYDAQGQLLASNFLDYAMPRADDSVFVDAVLVENPSPLGPLGIRGVGEPPIVPGGAAVANAVREVTGVRFEQLPIRPQALWKAMNS